MSRIIFTFVLVALFSVGASTSEAYSTTAQEGFSVDSKTAVFVIEYAFGHESYELEMPFHAVRTNTSTRRDVLGFEVLTMDGKQGKGSAVGIVLSNTVLKNNQYVTPKGKSVKFRLLVLYTRSEDEVSDTFRTQVTSLPFTFKGERELQLNEFELRSYTTKLVPLTHGTPIRIMNTEVQ